MSNEAKVLTAWKEIAAYLGKGVRTVQRWEQVLGLPVRRPKNQGKGFVVASTHDLDEWLATVWARRQLGANENLRSSIDEHIRLRQTNRELIHDLTQAMEGLTGESQALVRAVSRSSEAKSRTTEKPDRSPDRNTISRSRR